jgi:hypothetical protein
VELGNPSSRRRDCSHTSSAVALTKALYSDSVLDQEIVTYFQELQELQEIRLESKNTRKPPVDRWSSKHLAQSESEKALSRLDDDLVMQRPSSIVNFR